MEIGTWTSRSQKSITCHTDEWSGEVEQRLILQSFLYDYSGVESRKLQYDFDFLNSIIFGVNMPTTEKLELIESFLVCAKITSAMNLYSTRKYFTTDKKYLIDLFTLFVKSINNPIQRKE